MLCQKLNRKLIWMLLKPPAQTEAILPGGMQVAEHNEEIAISLSDEQVFLGELTSQGLNMGAIAEYTERNELTYDEMAGIIGEEYFGGVAFSMPPLTPQQKMTHITNHPTIAVLVGKFRITPWLFVQAALQKHYTILFFLQ